jgi:ABC-type transport system substrate-binding protein
VYENLLWYNGSSATQLIPWLASNYSVSSNEANWNFTLRSGITFADGEPLNATSVYFSYYRALLTDGSTPNTHGTEGASSLQKFLNSSLSSSLCSCAQTYNSQYVQEVLAQNFVHVTGPMTFTFNLLNPTSEFSDIIAGPNTVQIVAPMYVMEHDLALWNQSSTSYTLPYPNLSGNLSSMIQQYFLDEVATCNSGITPNGCGTTYLDGSYQGSLAGTGPYTIQSVASDSSLIVLKANPNYWGGPFQYSGGSKIAPTFTTVDLKNVPQLSTREIDLKSAAQSGQAMIADIPNTNLYDVANRSAWLNNNQLVSSIPGISLYGPYTSLAYQAYAFDSNVTNPQTGTYYTFQPFADIRLRLAFADSVNLTSLLQSAANGLDAAANGPIPPGTAPAGSYNASITPLYSYNLTAVQDLLLSAMENPITHFTFVNGTVAPSGVFDNTFGCVTLNNNGMCSNPVPQTITLVYPDGDGVEEAIYDQMANAVNNASGTYNMGLTVTVEPLPIGSIFPYVVSDELYLNLLGFAPSDSYALDYLQVLSPGMAIPPTGWNVTAFGTLYQQAQLAAASGNNTGLAKVTNLMVELSNQNVYYIYAYFFEYFFASTSNISGVSYNIPLTSIYYFADLT